MKIRKMKAIGFKNKIKNKIERFWYWINKPASGKELFFQICLVFTMILIAFISLGLFLNVLP